MNTILCPSALLALHQDVILLDCSQPSIFSCLSSIVERRERAASELVTSAKREARGVGGGWGSGRTGSRGGGEGVVGRGVQGAVLFHLLNWFSCIKTSETSTNSKILEYIRRNELPKFILCSIRSN